MTPRSYEFTCRICGRTVTESTDNEVCANCALNPAAGPARPMTPPPPAKKAPPPAPRKPGGFTITFRSVTACKGCGGKGTKTGCGLCGKKS